MKALKKLLRPVRYFKKLIIFYRKLLTVHDVVINLNSQIDQLRHKIEETNTITKVNNDILRSLIAHHKGEKTNPLLLPLLSGKHVTSYEFYRDMFQSSVNSFELNTDLLQHYLSVRVNPKKSSCIVFGEPFLKLNQYFSQVTYVKPKKMPPALFDHIINENVYTHAIISNTLVFNFLFAYTSLYKKLHKIISLELLLVVPGPSENDLLFCLQNEKLHYSTNIQAIIDQLHDAGFFGIENINSSGSSKITRRNRGKGSYQFLIKQISKIPSNLSVDSNLIVARRIPLYTDIEK